MTDFEAQETQKTYELVELLIEESKAGAIEWVEDTDEAAIPGDAFNAWVAGKELFVRSRDGDGRQPYIFMILDSGNVIQRLSTDASQTGLPADWQTRVGELYELARSRGRRSVRAIDEVMSAIRAGKERREAEDIPF